MKHRRTAAGLSVADVAARIATEPHHEPEHLRIERLKLIEADAAPMTLTTVVGLRRIYRFDIRILSVLEAIRQGTPASLPQLCRVCACSESDRCAFPDGGACHWSTDHLCSSCADLVRAAAA